MKTGSTVITISTENFSLHAGVQSFAVRVYPTRNPKPSGDSPQRSLAPMSNFLLERVA